MEELPFVTIELVKLGKVPGFASSGHGGRACSAGRDAEAIGRISEILRAALKDITLWITAHRRQTLGNYERILEMQNGRVEELPKL